MRRLISLLKKTALLVVLLFLAFIAMDWFFPLPIEEFKKRHFSQIVVDRHGAPLRAFADPQGIWRYPLELADISPLYLEALINYEDKYYYQHFGVNPLSVIRALGQRIKHGSFVSGASTITMQVARIMKPHRKSLTGKALQMFRALQLEWHYSKEEILTFYVNYAPFGGNIEGVQAASHVYFNKQASQLTHAEAALLAVLPQAPSRYRPDKHPKRARQARNKLLKRLKHNQIWSETIVKESQQEPVIANRNPTPMIAPLLARKLRKENPNQRIIQTSIDIQIQNEMEWLLKDYISSKPANTSAAILIIENASMTPLVYIGSANLSDEKRSGHVDMIQAIRSPGSTLKPFIYGLAIDQGMIHSESLLLNVPMSFNGYRPKNFSDHFTGPVSVSNALIHSLNMPAVQVLNHIQPQNFYIKLKNAGLDIYLPEHAQPNLSLALGGGGTTLEQLTGLFSSLGNQGISGQIRYNHEQPLFTYPILSPGSAWIIQKTLTQAPDTKSIYSRKANRYNSIAYKTGTSYGSRDAWVLASNPKITIGIWVGQPDGSFSPDQTGRNTAVPLLHKTLALLPKSFHDKPVKPATVTQANICWPLGIKLNNQKSHHCHQKRLAYLLEDTAPPTTNGPLNDGFSDLMQLVNTDIESGLRVMPECHQGEINQHIIAVWPALLDPWLPKPFQRKALLPPLSSKCHIGQSTNQLMIQGVHNNAILYPEVSTSGLSELQLSVEGSSGKNHWFVNGVLQKSADNQLTLYQLPPGNYQVAVVDNTAQQAEIFFKVRN